MSSSSSSNSFSNFAQQAQSYQEEQQKPAPGERKRKLENLSHEVLETMNHYEVLGIHWQSTRSDIIRAYRDQARQWHPDKQHPADRDVATRRFKRIQAAHECLTDDKLRLLYDEYLRVCTGYSSDGSFEGTFDEFQHYVQHTFFPSGKTYEETILSRTADDDIFNLTQFAPSLEDFKYLCYGTGGVFASVYLVYKFFFAERWWLQNVPFMMAFEWAELTLPESFELVLSEMSMNLVAAPSWMRVIGARKKSM